MLLEHWTYLLEVKAIPWLLGITIFIILPVLVARGIGQQGKD